MAPLPDSHYTTPEAKFLRSVLAQIDQTWENPEPVFDLLRANLDKLNEALLERLPQIFEELLAEEMPSKIAALLKIFGEQIQDLLSAIEKLILKSVSLLTKLPCKSSPAKHSSGVGESTAHH